MSREIAHGSWSGQVGDTYWGLTRKIGPWTATAADARRTQGGGEHAGHGNWWQSFNPKPYIQTAPLSGPARYKTFDVVFDIDFKTPADLKIPKLKPATRFKRSLAGIGETNGTGFGPNKNLDQVYDRDVVMGSATTSTSFSPPPSPFPRHFQRNDDLFLETGNGFRAPSSAYSSMSSRRPSTQSSTDGGVVDRGN